MRCGFENWKGVFKVDLFSFISNIGALQAILLIVGLGLLVVEIFHPGFGAPGITGLILLVLGIVLTAKSITEAIIMIIIIIVLLGIAAILFFYSASRGRLSKNIVLSEALNKESGFISTENLEEYLGAEGHAITPLRPAGIAEFDGVKLDVVTQGEFIARDTRVKVISVSGRRIVVREVSSVQ
jgi:membrane-bound ClpP family serine protease